MMQSHKPLEVERLRWSIKTVKTNIHQSIIESINGFCAFILMRNNLCSFSLRVHVVLLNVNTFGTKLQRKSSSLHWFLYSWHSVYAPIKINSRSSQRMLFFSHKHCMPLQRAWTILDVKPNHICCPAHVTPNNSFFSFNTFTMDFVLLYSTF